MSKIIRCSNNHYYDITKFENCPHCLNQNFNFGEMIVDKREVDRCAREYLELKMREKESRRFEGEQKKEEIKPFIETSPSEADRSDFPTVMENTRKPLSDSDKTVGIYANRKKDYYVTGWLTCVDGPDKGHCFSLHFGFNTIGYSRENTISILEDMMIAKKRHCSIVYDDRRNQFHLLPEENNLVFLNQKSIMEVETLCSGDEIKIGTSTFVFIAFCEGNRKWKKEEIRNGKSHFRF